MDPSEIPDPANQIRQAMKANNKPEIVAICDRLHQLRRAISSGHLPLDDVKSAAVFSSFADLLLRMTAQLIHSSNCGVHLRREPLLVLLTFLAADRRDKEVHLTFAGESEAIENVCGACEIITAHGDHVFTDEERLLAAEVLLAMHQENIVLIAKDEATSFCTRVREILLELGHDCARTPPIHRTARMLIRPARP